MTVKLYDKYFALILLLALSLRLLWALFVPVIPISDSHAYDMFARTLSQYGVFGWTAQEPFAFWPVGTSAAYAALYKIFGVNSISIIILNIVLNLGVIVCSFILAQHFFNRQMAYMASLILALWPSHIFFTTILASEILYMFLTGLAAVFWFVPSTHRLKYFVLSGFFLALACYVRPTAMLLPIVFSAGFLLSRPHWRTQIAGCLIVFLVMAGMIAPWTYRNYKLYNAFIPISTNGGITLWMGNNRQGTLDYAYVPQSVLHLNDYEQSRKLSREAIEYIQQEPVAFVLRALKKLYHLHSHETIGVSWNEKGLTQAFGDRILMPLKALTQAYWLAVLLGALAGLVLLIRNTGFLNTLFHPLVVLWLYYAGIHSIILAQDRYHFSFVISLTLFAAYAGQQLLLFYKADVK